VRCQVSGLLLTMSVFVIMVGIIQIN
jgi:hypothetical protein